MVFPEQEFQSIDDKPAKAVDSSKVYKIKYSINILPSIGMYIKNCPETG